MGHLGLAAESAAAMPLHFSVNVLEPTKKTSLQTLSEDYRIIEWF